MHFLPFPALKKSSPRIFCHFPHLGNRPHVFFAISHAQEIVPTYFLPFPALRKSSPRIFCHFPHLGNRPHVFFVKSSLESSYFKERKRKIALSIIYPSSFYALRPLLQYRKRFLRQYFLPNPLPFPVF